MQKIPAILATIAAEKQIKLLYACETGRAGNNIKGSITRLIRRFHINRETSYKRRKCIVDKNEDSVLWRMMTYTRN